MMVTFPCRAAIAAPTSLSLASALLLGSAGCSGGETASGPTFAQVAPIIHERCSVCHRPGEAAPFSLLSYEDVRKKARQIRVVTESGYMPPWLPAPNTDPHVAAFEGDRSLPEDERDLLHAWIEAGAPEGSPGAAPQPPIWSTEWQLGTPDLVMTMPEAFQLPEEGRDIYRNFVIPAVPMDTGASGGQRYVRAVEWRPDNRQVVHHAVLYIDRSGGARAREQEDPLPGYGGMSASPALMPEGQFYGWTPGNVPRPGSEEFSWSLDERTDIVLQLHLRPTGVPESVKVSIGLYFAEEPPERHPMSLRLRSRIIDIPPGKKDYVVRDSYVLPTDLEILGIYPHAHYLGKDMRGWATLPDGSERQLFHIPDWDFNWQDDYFYEEPLSLPAGTKLSMLYVFDNSADNALNPHSPPRRVVHGEQSDDEMAELMMQVLPETEEDLPILWRDFSWKLLRDSQRYYRILARSQPDNAGWHRQLAELALRAGEGAESIARHRRWSELRPKNKTLPFLGMARAMLIEEQYTEAAATMRDVLSRKPAHKEARTILGRALLGAGELTAARTELERVLGEDPGASEAEANLALGEVFAREGDSEAALARYRASLAIDPNRVRALNLMSAIQPRDGAIASWRAAVRLYRRNFLEADHARQVEETVALENLAQALEGAGRTDEAAEYRRWAQAIRLP